MSNEDKVDDTSKIALVPEKEYFYYKYGDSNFTYNIVIFRFDFIYVYDTRSKRYRIYN